MKIIVTGAIMTIMGLFVVLVCTVGKGIEERKALEQRVAALELRLDTNTIVLGKVMGAIQYTEKPVSMPVIIETKP